MTNWPFRVTVALLGLTLAFALFWTDRFWVLHDRPRVDYRAAVKLPPELADIGRELDFYGVHAQRLKTKAEEFMVYYRLTKGLPTAPPRSSEADARPAMGYSVREVAFLGMPFGYYEELGPVLFYRNDWGTVYGQLDAPSQKRLDEANGGDTKQLGGIYPFWVHTWGWLWVLGVGLAFWFWHRGNVRRREALGLID